MNKGVIAAVAIAFLLIAVFKPESQTPVTPGDLAEGAFETIDEEPVSKTASQPRTLVGTYHIVARRRASDVAGPPDDPTLEALLVSDADFGDTLQWIDGSTCENWGIGSSAYLPLNLEDPNLSDTQVPPNDPPITVGDKLQNEALTLNCEGSPVAALVKVDERVFIVPTPSGLTNIIFERDLTSNQILRFQEELKTMKFFDGEPTSVWSEAAMAGVGFFSSYKGAEFRFQRPAITENLLDGLGVLTPLKDIAAANEIASPSIADRFPDYEPKLSEDTVLDYRFALSGEIADLPEVTDENFTSVLFEVNKRHTLALENPGAWEKGQMPLGADGDEYVPSDEELLADALGTRLSEYLAGQTLDDILTKAWRGSHIFPPKVEYDTFSFRHVDVMGSGRFFYASAPNRITIDFEKMMSDAE
jgi:hypothetical protein